MAAFAKNTSNGRNTNMFRKHFNAGTVVAIVALVFAMTGGAFAVSSKGGSQGPVASVAKKKKAKVLRGPRGPRGATGPVGPVGLTGPVGPVGPAGAAGKDGLNGKDGLQGPEGKDGPQGPAGPQGAQGPTGEPWTAGGVLPPGKTETGEWGGAAVVSSAALISVSFTLPVEPAPTFVFVKPGEDKSGEGCPGVVNGLPTAEPGTLCVYAASLPAGKAPAPVLTTNADGSGLNPGASQTGAVMFFSCEPETACFQLGTWAVTATE